jgi:hypothetical protein
VAPPPTCRSISYLRHDPLVFAGKEREEDIIAETMAVPLQPIRAFGQSEGEWSNYLTFRDNLQALKALFGSFGERENIVR